MKNAVEKWERLGIIPPRDELQVSAVGLSAARIAPAVSSSIDQAALEGAAAEALTQTAIESHTVVAAETVTGPASQQKVYHVEAAHSAGPSAAPKPHATAPASQLSQRMQRVQETCARLLPIKGRSLPSSVGTQANWMLKLLFHPEAIVVLLLILACFLAIVIFDDREEAVDMAALSEAPAALVEPPVPLADPAPAVAVPAPAVTAEVAAVPPAATPPAAAPQPTASVPPAAPAEAPIAGQAPPMQAPAVASEQPLSPGAYVPYVAQANPGVHPPAATPQAPAGPATSPLTVTAVTPPPVQNTTIQRPLGPHANTPPSAATQQQLPWNGAYPTAMPPQAATNQPAAIGGLPPVQPQVAVQPQASVWPQTATPMFEAPPTGPGATNTASSRPQPQRIINPMYTPLPATLNRPAADLSAYPTTVAPELQWTPQHVAQRPPQPAATPGAAQLRGIIEQPQSGTLHEHY